MSPGCTPHHRCGARPQGLGAVAVIVILVVLAALAAAVLRLGQQSQSMTEQDVMGARASSTARAGIEWGLYQAFKGSWTSCSGASQTLDRSADAAGMRVTVSCDSTVYYEGLDSNGAPVQVRVFTIDAVACTSSSAGTACPDASASQRGGYVEHRRQVQAVN
ncbi:MAG: MSHA biogenesis protein MshP [Burkholderiales bacterium PBB5]|nr:MAG: MSHA biogenesis protein MshP [Burkholderiales bacterium PBB5]